MKIFVGILVLVLTTCTILAQKPRENVLPLGPIDKGRVNAIEAMLSERPKGFGDRIEKRVSWDKLLSSGQFKALLLDADSLAKLPFPLLTEEIYFSYYKGFDSETSKRFIMNRRWWLSKLVWAECLTNKGKYLPAINNALKDFLYTTSWSFPAEDRSKTNYHGSLFTIGLSSAAYGYEVAQTLYLLDTKLDGALKKQLLNALSLKVFKPVLDAVQNNDEKAQFTSLTNTGNYNAVTLANVTGAALAVVKDKKQRALFAYIAERYSNNYLQGISEDGYCSEGIDYYAFGFGHYLLLRESLWQATMGKIDLLKREKVSKAAVFVPRMEIINGLFPSIGDCVQNPKPHPFVMFYLKRSFNLAFRGYDTVSYNDIDQHSLAYIMYFFPNSLPKISDREINSEYQVRHYFDKAGVLILRPDASAKVGLGVALKGGHNAEHHNHNDLGSFSLVVGDELLMGDPGLATYTPKYFSAERYKLFKTAASYGHPVPLVAETQQQPGAFAKAIIEETEFTPNLDKITMDLSSAYATPSLLKLRRIFTYEREIEGMLRVEDEFEYRMAKRFETALITRYPWKQIGENEIEIFGDKYSLRIRAEHTGDVIWSEEMINEGPSPYRRIAVKIKEEKIMGSISLVFTPQTITK